MVPAQCLEDAVKTYLITGSHYYYPESGTRDWIKVFRTDDASFALDVFAATIQDRREDHFTLVRIDAGGWSVIASRSREETPAS